MNGDDVAAAAHSCTLHFPTWAFAMLSTSQTLHLDVIAERQSANPARRTNSTRSNSDNTITTADGPRCATQTRYY